MSEIYVEDRRTYDEVMRGARENERRRQAGRRPVVIPTVQQEYERPVLLDRAKEISKTIAICGAGPSMPKQADLAQQLDDERQELTEVRQRPLLAEVIRAVAKAYGFTSNDLKAARRDAGATQARQVSYLLCKMLTLRGLPPIGDAHGGRDHTTILHGVRKAEAIEVDGRDGEPSTLRVELEALHTMADPVSAWAASAARLHPLKASREWKPRHRG